MRNESEARKINGIFRIILILAISFLLLLFCISFAATDMHTKRDRFSLLSKLKLEH